MKKVIILILLWLLQSCNSQKKFNKLSPNLPYNSIVCYKAINDTDTYVLALFPNSTYVFGKNLGQLFSIGHYEEKNGVLSFSSFIQSFDDIPMIVKESFIPKLDSNIVKLSIVSGVFFLNEWVGFAPTSIEVDGQFFSDGLSSSPIKFDSTYTTYYKTSTSEKIFLRGRTLPDNIYYQPQDTINNCFEWYYLHFHKNQFSIFDPSKVMLDTSILKIPVNLLDIDAKDQIIEFKKLEHFEPFAGLNATPEAATLSAYHYFVAQGRLILIKK